ncbi:sigma-54-dependent transcriptional regulator [Novosphingobium taihuense]|uniref:DNA-binding transcriptional regulator NtrC n=1 Tax=Novosphingobium taihuense TaxID=260085 RepID=A0A7W7ACQ3_9SPHN|nr:sigma-54 dependent transcriptional regulator [Novosphingobium taihuense]MBB4613830.1 two-component system nitrogen regulation response regulator GlnG [Novosphingobium taihuense]TWH83338.1 two-component system nitrogen regulation response regulator GlnG [Novosphingobium taihuense]
MTKRVLLVEDDASIALVITAALEAEGFAIDRCDSVAGRDRFLAQNDYRLLLTDVMLTDGDGIESLGPVRDAHPSMPIIILSAQNTLDTAVRASETGAFEYFPKPFDLEELVRTVTQAIGKAEAAEIDVPQDVTQGLPLVGRSAAMQAVYRMITRVLRNDLTVLILGESGTGKELVAEAIHQLGNRRAGPFVAVNTAAIPAELIESELFGHERGAFTGAVVRSIGKFEQASGGTLFLDEIGDMPMQAQTRLLRALQSGRIRRVGGRDEITLDCRIVAATNRDLLPMIANGTFREDLYYRLAVVPIELPPLRERADDIEALSRHFLASAAAEGLPRRQLTQAGADLLAQQPWRGNVRELRNFIYRLALLAREEVIDAASIEPLLVHTESGAQSRLTPEATELAGPSDMANAVGHWLSTNAPAQGEVYDAALAAFERPLFISILAQTGGNQLRAAQILGINRNTLRKRLSVLGIAPEDYTPRY